MPAVTRLADQGTGHGCWPARGNDQASPNVFVNNIPLHRVTDHWPVHCCGPACHDSNLAEGDLTVYANNLSVGRIGDAVACGSKVAEGSPNVFADGTPGVVIPLQTFEDGKVVEEIVKVPANTWTLEAVATLIFGAGVNAPNDDPGSPVIDFGIKETLPPATGDDSTLPDTTPPIVDEGAPTTCGNFTVSPAIDYNAKLSTNYALKDLSIKATFPHTIVGQNDLLADEIICNLQAVAENILEPLREVYPGFKINSGFRKNPPGKDSVSSQHNKGQAVDIQWPGISSTEYMIRAEWIRDNLPLDQLIFEHGKSIWLHISYNRTSAKQRGSLLTYYPPVKPNYKPGLKNYYA